MKAIGPSPAPSGGPLSAAADSRSRGTTAAAHGALAYLFFMLEKLPESIGHALDGQRAGMEQIAFRKLLDNREVPVLAVESTAFKHLHRLPIGYTADGEGISPPIAWRNVPQNAVCAALIVEDADSPTPHPLVHAIAVLEGRDGFLAAGALASPDHEGIGVSTGRNSFLRHAWLPPDPPPGHGEHRYAFQIFALTSIPDPSHGLGRSELVAAVMGNAVAAGCLIGVYAREQRIEAGDKAVAIEDFPLQVQLAEG